MVTPMYFKLCSHSARGQRGMNPLRKRWQKPNSGADQRVSLALSFT